MKDKPTPPTQLNDRAIRVFVSSTFRDMHAEREELVKHVFPQLRKLCGERGVTWGEVDLRWGITEEEKAEGKVLPICLAEIHRSRPYFIGLLGERYGWIPDEIPEEIIEQEPWLKDHLKHSVTELEILHGVLNNPEMAEHAFFYLRSPSYIETLPSSERADFTAEDAESTEKLRRLKERIEQSGFPVRKDYSNPKAFGEQALKSEVAWFVKTICYYFLDALLNEQYETKSVTEGARRATGVTLFANLQTTPPCLFFLSKNNSFWRYLPLHLP